MRPPHLAAILPWQGTYDFYRDRTRQDGIYASGFLKRWWNRNVLRNQHGNPDSDCRDIYTDERVTGPAHLSQAELAANRADYLGDVLAHPLNDSFYRERTPDLSKIDYPALSRTGVGWGFTLVQAAPAPTPRCETTRLFCNRFPAGEVLSAFSRPSEVLTPAPSAHRTGRSRTVSLYGTA